MQTVAIFQRNDFKRVALFQYVRKVFQFAVHAGAYGVSRQPLGNRLRRLHAGSVFFRFQYVAVFQNDIHNEFSSVFFVFRKRICRYSVFRANKKAPRTMPRSACFPQAKTHCLRTQSLRGSTLIAGRRAENSARDRPLYLCRFIKCTQSGFAFSGISRLAAEGQPLCVPADEKLLVFTQPDGTPDRLSLF